MSSLKRAKMNMKRGRTLIVGHGRLFVLKKLKVQVSEAMVRQCRAALK
jgi:hypothetical protein